MTPEGKIVFSLFFIAFTLGVFFPEDGETIGHNIMMYFIFWIIVYIIYKIKSKKIK